MITYGKSPEVLATYDITCPEMLLYQYLPVVFPQDFGSRVFLPRNLSWMRPILDDVPRTPTDYVYITAKCLYVTKDNMGNRGGWHTDGFGTTDVNYIWYDRFPTEFCVQKFSDISEDHEVSVAQFTNQAIVNNIVRYPCNTLLRLTQENVHRVTQSFSGEDGGFRTFIKISVSKERYNLEGNSHNHLVDYNWPMVPRDTQRNTPHKDKL